MSVVTQAARDPDLATLYLYRKIAYSSDFTEKLDFEIGKRIGSCTTGLGKYITGKRRISKAQNNTPNFIDDIPKKERNQLHNTGYLSLGKFFDDSTIEEVREKYTELINDESRSRVRTEYEGTVYSRQVPKSATDFPEVKKLITDELKKYIRSYYNSYFDIMTVQAWRNHGISPEMKQKAIEESLLSSDWHCDNRFPSIFKLFVNLSDVSENHGPFHILNRNKTIQLMNQGHGKRISAENMSQVSGDRDIKTATGPKGTAMLANTEHCYHRAGHPSEDNYRDILQFQFVPSDEPLPENWIENVKDNI